MRLVLGGTAVILAALSLGFISPGVLVLLCFLFFFFSGLIGKVCGNDFESLMMCFGKVCVCSVAAVLMHMAGIPFFLLFVFTIFFLWAIHQ